MSKDLPEYIATWRKITPVDLDAPIPCPRTSQSCVAYKNRYLVIIGGETAVDPNNKDSESDNKKQDQSAAKGDDDSGSSSEVSDSKYATIGDVWIFDTLQRKWI